MIKAQSQRRISDYREEYWITQINKDYYFAWKPINRFRISYHTKSPHCIVVDRVFKLRKINLKGKKICIKSKVSKQEGKYKTHWKILKSLPGIEPEAFGVVLLCTIHYTNRAITILMYKLRYINITSTIQ